MRKYSLCLSIDSPNLFKKAANLRQGKKNSMDAWIVKEVRPYRLIMGGDGRHAVVEVRCGHVYCLDCDHPRHVAPDTAEGMAVVVGPHGWLDRDRAIALFRRMVDGEEHYSEMLW